MLRIGIIAMGWAGNTHAKYLTTRDDVEIVALCDPDALRLQKGIDDFGGKGFGDLETMLAETELDAVYLCTPSTIRREPLLACADRGIPVFCEKPVERRAAVADEIAAELRRLDARVQVGFVFRSMPLAREARKAVADDRVHLIQSMYGCPVCLTKELSSWFYDKELSGGALVDQATHNLDLLRYIFGEVAEVTGFAGNPVEPKKEGYTVDEVVALSLRFECGALCSHVHTWVGDEWRNEMVFVGERRIYRLSLTDGRLVVKEKKGTWDYNQDQDHMYDYENDVFIEQVKTGDWSKNPSTYDDALKTLKLTLECDRAAGGSPK